MTVGHFFYNIFQILLNGTLNHLHCSDCGIQLYECSPDAFLSYAGKNWRKRHVFMNRWRKEISQVDACWPSQIQTFNFLNTFLHRFGCFVNELILKLTVLTFRWGDWKSFPGGLHPEDHQPEEWTTVIHCRWSRGPWWRGFWCERPCSRPTECKWRMVRCVYKYILNLISRQYDLNSTTGSCLLSRSLTGWTMLMH